MIMRHVSHDQVLCIPSEPRLLEKIWVSPPLFLEVSMLVLQLALDEGHTSVNSKFCPEAVLLLNFQAIVGPNVVIQLCQIAVNKNFPHVICPSDLFQVGLFQLKCKQTLVVTPPLWNCRQEAVNLWVSINEKEMWEITHNEYNFKNGTGDSLHFKSPFKKTSGIWKNQPNSAGWENQRNWMKMAKPAELK